MYIIIYGTSSYTDVCMYVCIYRGCLQYIGHDMFGKKRAEKQNNTLN